MNLEDREYMKKRLKELVTMQVESLRGTCEITIDESYPCLYNDHAMYNLFYDNSVALLGKDKVKILREPTMGVESFAYFSLKVPAMFYQLGCGNLEKGIIYPLHSSRFDIDEECLQIGVAVHCNMAVNYLNKL